MFRTVLWIAAACAAVLVALAVSRSLNFDRPAPPKPPEAPAAPKAAPAKPAAVEAPASIPTPTSPPPPTPEEAQVQDDAAATGMTTVEPEHPSPPN